LDISIQNKKVCYVPHKQLKTFFSTSGIHEFNKVAFVIIMSDSDSAFRGDNRDEDQNLQKLWGQTNAV
jgi:hypothetical protein